MNLKKELWTNLLLVKNKFLKDQLCHKERLSELAILSIEKEMLAELECKNLISNFASQKVRKIYEFIIKYNKRPCLKLSPGPPNSLSRPYPHKLSRVEDSLRIVLFKTERHFRLERKLCNYVSNCMCCNLY